MSYDYADSEVDARVIADLRAERDELLKALQLLWVEVVASGNSKATDYGWPKACAAASKALGPHAAGEKTK